MINTTIMTTAIVIHSMRRDILRAHTITVSINNHRRARMRNRDRDRAIRAQRDAISAHIDSRERRSGVRDSNRVDCARYGSREMRARAREINCVIRARDVTMYTFDSAGRRVARGRAIAAAVASIDLLANDAITTVIASAQRETHASIATHCDWRAQIREFAPRDNRRGARVGNIIHRNSISARDEKNAPIIAQSQFQRGDACARNLAPYNARAGAQERKYPHTVCARDCDC
ncbi:MAG: hypothetical protein M0R66_03455 [Candidatus Omnitrophica bacterium]|nr:hypothetical protein [Candidatus Omnitrophota bacterium]